MITANGNGVYTGIVYLRKNQNQGEEYDWGYVGCTLDPAERNRKWNNPKTTNYGGKKVMEARALWNIKLFSYTVLETYTTDNSQNKYDSKASAARALNVNVGSIASAVKTKGLVRNRWRITLA